ncbi:MAG TPA: hypothetical protein VEW93_04425 [Acidimicrobiales bacterium]|nr:hypothetical protein [Acidimicrobiales bacterium]
MTAVVVALAVVVAVLTLLVLGLLRSHADILRRLHEIDGGTERAGAARGSAPRTVGRDEFTTFPEVQAPPEREGFTESRDLSGVGVDDDALTVRVTGVQHRTLVAFLSGSCLTCQRFWDAFQKPAKLGLPSDVRPVIVTKGPEAESPARVAELAPRQVPVVMASDAWDAYDVPGSPYFVLVDGRTGTVQGEGTGIDWPQVRGLLTQVTDDATYAEGLEARRVAKHRADDERERRVDTELLAAGIGPDDPSLYGEAADEAPPAADR